MLEKMRKIYDGGDLVLDLDFSNQSSPKLPPALRNPPEFEVFSADIFWNREKDKVSVMYNYSQFLDMKVFEF